MSADRIVYCLERVSDDREFERLCSALLAGTDYAGIDPLGAPVTVVETPSSEPTRLIGASFSLTSSGGTGKPS